MTSAQTQDIIRRSAEATHADWKRAPEFDFCETDKAKTGTRTSAVFMIEGSPYYRLVQLNGEDLPAGQEAAERAKLDSIIQQRKHETPDQRAKRTAQYQKEREQDQALLNQMTIAMDFTYERNDVVDSHPVYVFGAKPRPDYHPTNMETEVLTGMQGKLWIDQSSLRWVRVEAQVVTPVSIAGFLARVEPGTHFGLEERPVDSDLWLPFHYTMEAHAKVVFLFQHSSQDDETYFHYMPNGKLSADSCKSGHNSQTQ